MLGVILPHFYVIEVVMYWRSEKNMSNTYSFILLSVIIIIIISSSSSSSSSSSILRRRFEAALLLASGFESRWARVSSVVLCIVYVVASATSWSLVQSRTGCVCVTNCCDLQNSTLRRPKPK
jgi:hypothetical protein